MAHRASRPEERDPRRSQALAVFEEYLGRSEQSTGQSPFQLLRAHPEIQAELRELFRGLARFELFLVGERHGQTAVCDPLPAVRRKRFRRPLLLPAALAAGLLAFVAWSLWPPLPLAASWTEANVKGATDVFRSVEQFVRDSDKQAWRSITPKLIDDLSALPALVQSANLQGVDAAAVLDENRKALARLHQAVLAAADATDPMPEPLLQRIRAALVHPVARPLKSSLTLMLVQPPDRTQRRPPGTPADGGSLSVSPSPGRLPQILTLKAIDLDLDGFELIGAEVYLQEVELGRLEFRRPYLAGLTPLENYWIPPGDWRITVVDHEGQRISQTRLLADDQPLPHQVLFFRSEEPVLASMVAIPASHIPYGMPPTEPSLHHFRERLVAVPGFHLDPYETSRKGYQEFLQFSQQHPEWFEPSLKLPHGFDANGDPEPGTEDVAVAYVNWHDAVRFANWAGKRLARDREWESAAGGPTGRRYPWGGTPDETRVEPYPLAFELNPLAEAHVSGTSPTLVHALPQGATPGDDHPPIYRMADNVSEWVEDLLVYTNTRGVSTIFPGQRVVRGGERALLFPGLLDDQVRVELRAGYYPDFPGMTGIRCAKTSYLAWLAEYEGN